jgi:hypothetical protein
MHTNIITRSKYRGKLQCLNESGACLGKLKDIRMTIRVCCLEEATHWLKRTNISIPNQMTKHVIKHSSSFTSQMIFSVDSIVSRTRRTFAVKITGRRIGASRTGPGIRPSSVAKSVRTSMSAIGSCEKRPLSQIFLLLSRACLGKLTIVLEQDGAKRRFFRAPA